jgi:hypothetical protein
VLVSVTGVAGELVRVTIARMLAPATAPARLPAPRPARRTPEPAHDADAA